VGRADTSGRIEPGPTHLILSNHIYCRFVDGCSVPKGTLFRVGRRSCCDVMW